MARAFGASPAAGVAYEPTLQIRVLPGCRVCGERHPLAFSPPLDPSICPACHAPALDAGDVLVVPAMLAGFRGWLATRLMAAGRALKRLSRKERPE